MDELFGPGQPFEMAEIEIRGVMTRVWKNAPPSLRAILEISRLHGDAPFLVYEDERIAFEQHFAMAATFAWRLIDEYGVRKGDRVAIAMRNYPEWSVAFFAAAVCGAIVVPLNAWWTTPELEYGLRDSGTKVLIADGERAGMLDFPMIVARPGELVAEPYITELPDVELEPEDDATIFYTSGTTGRPKGALGTHRNICTNPMSLAYGQIAAAVRAGTEPPGPQRRVVLLSVPFFHATGCHSVLVTSALAGSAIVLMRKWDPERALELIERERVTQFGGVPTMAWQVLNSPRFAEFDTSSLTTVGYGGAPAAPRLVSRIGEQLPKRTPANGYGLTETSSVTTLNVGRDFQRKPDSVGPPVAVVDVRVVDLAGADLPVGSVGELLVRGPNVIKGYWNRPEETAATFVDGWLHTGDMARLDEDGFVYIVDRVKDMLIRGGENVYCAEVEAALFEHPAVADAAVIGLPHETLGEEVGAVVCLHSPVSSVDLQEFLRSRIAAFKVPVRFWLRTAELPRNPAGKVLKSQLRAEVL